MQNVSDIVVVGQGVVGLSAAIAMQNLGFNVIAVDANPPADTQKPAISRIYAINPASIQLLQKIQVWQHINHDEISTYDKMYVWEAKNGANIEFDARVSARPELGAMLEEETLKKALLKQAKAQKLRLINSFAVTDVIEKENRIQIINSAQTSINAKLVIIADGARSSLRDKLGVKITTWPYNQNAVIANVHTSKPHLKTAYQVFTENGPLAFLPQKDPLHSSIVWSVPPKVAEELLALPEDEFCAKLSKTFTHKLGDVSLRSPRHQFPLHMRHSKQYSGKNWVLMGDAAHTIHPLAGLGLNVGLTDLATWLELVSINNNNITSTKTLGAYQRKRKHDLWQVIALMQALHIIFTNKIPPLARLTSFGLNIVNSLTPLKKLIIQHASGINEHAL